MINVLIYGLNEQVAQQINRALCASSMSSRSMSSNGTLSGGYNPSFSTTSDAAQALGSRPSLVFCSADSRHYRPLLEEIRENRSDVPVVIVSDEPEFRAFADAMDRGAADFHYGPIDSHRVRSMVADYVNTLPIV
jgi:DNA-binding NtrC family response regulator